MEAEYNSIAEYAKKENISIQTVYNYINENKIPFITYKRGKTNGYLIRNI